MSGSQEGGRPTGEAGWGGGDSKDPKKTAKEEQQKKREQLINEANKFIVKHQRSFQMFLNPQESMKEVSFRAGDGFYIEYSTPPRITIDIKEFQWMKEKNYTEEMILWSVFHELGHFIDLQQSEEAIPATASLEERIKKGTERANALLEGFRHIEMMAEIHTNRVEQIIAKKNGGVLPKEWDKTIKFGSKKVPKRRAFVFLYKQLHRLYNCLDDMYVNSRVAIRAPVFGLNGNSGKEIERMYRDFLFPTSHERHGLPPEAGQPVDYSTQLLSQQIPNYLLRNRMVPSQKIILHERIDQLLLSQKIGSNKQALPSLAQQVDSFTNTRDTTNDHAGKRYKAIQSKLEKTYLDLLFEDLEKSPLPPPPPKGEGEPGEGDGDGDPSDEEAEETEPGKGKPKPGKEKPKPGEKNPWGDEDDDRPEPIDAGVIEDYIKAQTKWLTEQDKKQQELDKIKRMTPDERKLLAREQADAVLENLYNIKPETTKAYRLLEQSVAPYVSEVKDVLLRIIDTIDFEIEEQTITNMTVGKKNMPKLVEKIGANIATGTLNQVPKSAMTFHEQKDIKIKQTIHPNKMTFRLVIDGSGSMQGEKIQRARETVVLFLEGLAFFENTINLRFNPDPPFTVGLDVWMYGDKDKAASKLDTRAFITNNPEVKRAQILKAFEAIDANYGNNCDAQPIWKIAAQHTPKELDELKKGTAQEFVFQIGDGGYIHTSDYYDGSKDRMENDTLNTPAVKDLRNAVEELRHCHIVGRGILVSEHHEEAKPASPETTKGEGEAKPTDTSAVTTDETKFKKVWGDHGKLLTHAKNMPKVLGELLSEVIEKSEIKLRSR